MATPETIDAWRARHWGQPGSCPCGDPIILADTEQWAIPRCFDCWEEMTPEQREQARSAA
jgi:hypothetical protein